MPQVMPSTSIVCITVWKQAQLSHARAYPVVTIQSVRSPSNSRKQRRGTACTGSLRSLRTAATKASAVNALGSVSGCCNNGIWRRVARLVVIAPPEYPCNRSHRIMLPPTNGVNRRYHSFGICTAAGARYVTCDKAEADCARVRFRPAGRRFAAPPRSWMRSLSAYYPRLRRLQSGAHAKPGRRSFGGVSYRQRVSPRVELETETTSTPDIAVPRHQR